MILSTIIGVFILICLYSNPYGLNASSYYNLDFTQSYTSGPTISLKCLLFPSTSDLDLSFPFKTPFIIGVFYLWGVCYLIFGIISCFYVWLYKIVFEGEYPYLVLLGLGLVVTVLDFDFLLYSYIKFSPIILFLFSFGLRNSIGLSA